MILASAKAAAVYSIVRALSQSEDGRSFVADLFFALLPSAILGASFLLALFVLVQNATDRMKEEFLYAAAILGGADFIMGILPDELGGLALPAELAAIFFIPYKRYKTSAGRAFGILGMTVGVSMLALIVLCALFD